MSCNHHLWDEPGGLQCTRDLGHPGGHTYTDTHGSCVADKAERLATSRDRRSRREV